MFKDILKTIQGEFSGEAAKRYVGGITRFHRIQASPGYREAARYCTQLLKDYQIDTELLIFPADGKTFYWSCLMPQEWDVDEASLWLISPERKKLADYFESKLSIIQRSGSYDLKTDVVVLEDGEEKSEYKGLNLRRKIVLTSGDLRRVYELAVVKYGAAGIIFDGMREIPNVRSRFTISDALQYTSFWWGEETKKCFGFVLSPTQGERLRKLIKNENRKGKKVKVHAVVKSRFYDGSIDVVSGFIKGKTDEEVLLVAHLCHPQPSANDNASGCGTLIEVARTLKKLPPPKRGIRFLLLPEMTGTYAYLANNEDKIPKTVAGCNLDMVGENQELCGSSFLIEETPFALPSFTNELISRIRDELTSEQPSYTGAGGYGLFKYAVSPFSGGSDHYILSDPSVGIPTPMLIQWPDMFYHTSLDTLEKVDPKMIKRVGAVAATYIYFLANAGEEEGRWLGYEVISRYKRKVLKLSQDALTESMSSAKKNKSQIPFKLRLEFILERTKIGLDSLLKLGTKKDFIKKLKEEITHFTDSEITSGVHLEATSGTGKSRKLTTYEKRVKRIVPERSYRGPINLRPYIGRLNEKDREKLHRLRKEYKEKFSLLTTLGEYWTDGQRSLFEIANLIQLETGEEATRLLAEYFDILSKLSLMKMVTN